MPIISCIAEQKMGAKTQREPQSMAYFLLFLFFSFFTFSTAQTQTCKTQSFAKQFTTCTDLQILNSFLHWTYNPLNRTVDMAFTKRGTTSTHWIAWGINPIAKGMIGTQALVAYLQKDGKMKVYTSPVNSYSTKLQPAPLSFPFHSMSAQYSNSEMTIFATFTFSPGNTTFNHVWQEGPVLNGNSVEGHPFSSANMRSTGSIDFYSGQVVRTKAKSSSRIKFKRVHGILNAVSWGVLMPVGVLIARYLRRVNPARPAWFYLHRVSQTLAYGVGVAGWATGIKLGIQSTGIQHSSHRYIGITLFVLATLQVLALYFRPKTEHKYTSIWNVYHHLTGYSVIILSVVNVFIGLDILDPAKKWKMIYMGIIIALVVIAVILEVLTRIIFKCERSRKEPQPNTSTRVAADEQHGYESSELV